MLTSVTTALHDLAAYAILTTLFAVPLTAIAIGVLRFARRQWRWRRVLLVAVLIGFALPIAWQLISLDGLVGLLFGSFDDRTEYAPQYSAIGFWFVHDGMPEAEVRELVGDPLETYVHEPGVTAWRWTRSGNSYRVRVVLFREGRVIRKISEFYLD